MDALDAFTVIILAFGAGMVTHRVLWINLKTWMKSINEQV